MTAVDLDALDAVRAAGTPGPWQYDREAIFALGPMACAETNSRADAALIVAAVNALPELVAEARKLRALREAVEGLAEEWGGAEDEAGCPEPRVRYAAERLRTVLAAALTSEGERE